MTDQYDGFGLGTVADEAQDAALIAALRDDGHRAERWRWRRERARNFFMWTLRLYLVQDAYRWVMRVLTGRWVVLQELKPLPPDSNPFLYDHSHMGTPLVRGWMVMHEGFDNRNDPLPLKYVILINMRTGARFHLKLPEK